MSDAVCARRWSTARAVGKSVASARWGGRLARDARRCGRDGVNVHRAPSISPGEAEFYAAGSAAARLLYHVYLLRELGVKPRATLACDSSAARGVMQRAGPGRIRHLQTRFLWVQERAREGDFAVVAVPGASNAADLGTKILQSLSSSSRDRIVHELLHGSHGDNVVVLLVVEFSQVGSLGLLH